MNNVIKLFLEYLPMLIKAKDSIPGIMDYIARTKETLKQSKEWTKEDQDKFDRELEQKTSEPHWQPET